MSYKPRYDKGDWRASCDVCGRDYKASSLRKRWDGLMVCPSDWETRHPQDFVRGVVDTQVVPWIRQEPADTFIPVCTLLTRSGRADLGTADCMQADMVFDLSPYCTMQGSSSISDYAVADCAIASRPF